MSLYTYGETTKEKRESMMKRIPVTIDGVDCFVCKKPQTARVEEDVLVAPVRGQDIHYFGERTYCTVCGEEVFSKTIRLKNEIKLGSVYQKNVEGVRK